MLDKGKVAEIGSPKDLLKKNGLFKSLVETDNMSKHDCEHFSMMDDFASA